MQYRIKKDIKKVINVDEINEFNPYALYTKLRNEGLNFVILHPYDPEEIYFNETATGKYGFIKMSDSYKKLSDLGISKEEYSEDEENIAGPYAEAKVKVDSFEGHFRNFVIYLPEYVELERDALPSGISNPSSRDHSENPDWDNDFDIIIVF